VPLAFNTPFECQNSNAPTGIRVNLRAWPDGTALDVAAQRVIYAAPHSAIRIPGRPNADWNDVFPRWQPIVNTPAVSEVLSGCDDVAGRILECGELGLSCHALQVGAFKQALCRTRGENEDGADRCRPHRDP
jgi:hypothetical protein